MATRPRVRMYGTAACPYCTAARMLLEERGIAYEDVSVAGDAALRREMEHLSGRRSVPQIFIDGEPVGGFDELYALDRGGRLERLING